MMGAVVAVVEMAVMLIMFVLEMKVMQMRFVLW